LHTSRRASARTYRTYATRQNRIELTRAAPAASKNSEQIETKKNYSGNVHPRLEDWDDPLCQQEAVTLAALRVAIKKGIDAANG
jgi:hypothetical protein